MNRRPPTRPPRRVALASVAAALTLCLASCGDDPPSSGLSVHRSDEVHTHATAEETAAGAAVVRHLAATLYPELARGSANGNVVFSPSSVATSLGYLHAGAAGTIADQIEAVFGPVDGVDIDRAVRASAEATEDFAGPASTAEDPEANLLLHWADAIWGDASTTWSDEYLDALASDYGAAAFQVDFARDAPRARVEIDDWAGEYTAERVEDLLPDDAINDTTRLLLTSLTTVEVPWYDSMTVQAAAPFTRPDGSTVDAPMLGATLAARHQETATWQAVTLSLGGQDLAVTFVLPAPGKLSAVEGDLDEVLEQALAGSQKVSTALTFPAFALDEQVPIVDALEAAGVTAPFDDPGDDLAPMGMASGQGLDAFVHRATLGLDADGVHLAGEVPTSPDDAEAAPAGAIRFDRTFVFVVHDAVNGTPILLGRITDPTAS